MKFQAMVAAGLILAAGAGCASQVANDTGNDAEKLVDSIAFAKATAAILTIDYLPFQYKTDGCFARSIYMAMELAATGQESNAIFAFAQNGTALQVRDTQWGYHVAPMLFVGPSYERSRWMVMDPSIASAPITREQWVSRMGFRVGDPLYPAISTVPGAAYGPVDPRFSAVAAANSKSPLSDVTSFERMPAFEVSKIQLSCDVLHNYIGAEQAYNADEKKEKLVRRTSELVASLTKANKILPDAVFDAVRCASK